jgi:hypothetical protein
VSARLVSWEAISGRWSAAEQPGATSTAAASRLQAPGEGRQQLARVGSSQIERPRRGSGSDEDSEAVLLARDSSGNERAKDLPKEKMR